MAKNKSIATHRRYHLENLWRRIETKTKYNDTYLRGDKMPKNDKAE
jgi:hypothetical protein